MKILKQGDRCPLCGGIIRTEDEARLFLLSTQQGLPQILVLS